MALRSWLRDNALLLLAVGVAVALAFSVVAGGVGVLAFLLGGDPLVTLGGAFATVVLLVTTAAVLLGALAWTALGRARAAAAARRRRTRRRVDASRRRLARTLARAETASPRLADLGLSGTVAPPERDRAARLADLKRRYVEGDVSEATFERAVDDLLGGSRDGTSSRAPDATTGGADDRGSGVDAPSSRTRPPRRSPRERLRGDRVRE
jgi:uncharacterized membrane protein